MRKSLFAFRQRPSCIVGILVILTLLLAACGSASQAAPTASATKTSATITPPNDLLIPGELTVGSELTYPPKEFIDPTTQKPTGFDMDLITSMANRMGLKVNIVPSHFDTIINSLINKRFDVVIAAMHVTPARLQKVDFVVEARSGSSLLVLPGNPMHIQSFTNLCGKSVSAQSGTLQQFELQDASTNCVKNGKTPIQMTFLASQSDVIDTLLVKRVNATLQSSSVSSYFVKLRPGQLEVAGPVVDVQDEGIAIRKGDTSMLNAVQKAFNAVKADGTYHKLIVKWGLYQDELAEVDNRLVA